MKIALFSIFLSSVAYAHVPSPNLCSENDFDTMKEFFVEIEGSQFAKEGYQKNIGVRGGDCNDMYSLENSAKRNHPAHAPTPACGIIFILDEENQQSQASWILDTLGKTYTTKSGKTIPFCSSVRGFGPLPGSTVHN